MPRARASLDVDPPRTASRRQRVTVALSRGCLPATRPHASGPASPAPRPTHQIEPEAPRFWKPVPTRTTPRARSDCRVVEMEAIGRELLAIEQRYAPAARASPE